MPNFSQSNMAKSPEDISIDRKTQYPESEIMKTVHEFEPGEEKKECLSFRLSTKVNIQKKVSQKKRDNLFQKRIEDPTNESENIFLDIQKGNYKEHYAEK